MLYLVLAMVAGVISMWIAYFIRQRKVRHSISKEGYGCITGMIAFMLFWIIITWIGVYGDSSAFIREFRAVQATITEARASSNEKESSTVTEVLTRWNARLAGEQADNQNWFLDSMTDDRVDKLEPLR